MLIPTTTNEDISPTINLIKNIEWLTPRRIDDNILTIYISTISEKEKKWRREIDKLFGQ
jgi:hypothetical protein